MTEFAEMDEHGRVTKTRTIPQEAMTRCPHFILVPEHYRQDYSCRCNDPDHADMLSWGYEWRDGLWRAPENEEG